MRTTFGVELRREYPVAITGKSPWITYVGSPDGSRYAPDPPISEMATATGYDIRARARLICSPYAGHQLGSTERSLGRFHPKLRCGSYSPYPEATTLAIARHNDKSTQWKAR